MVGSNPPSWLTHIGWIKRDDWSGRSSPQYLTCLKTSRSLTDKLSFDVGLQEHSTGGAVIWVHVGSLSLYKHLEFIKTTSRLCLCRRGLLVDDPPSIQAEVRRREGAHRRWPDSGQRVHRTIPGRLKPAASLVTDALSRRLSAQKGTNRLEIQQWGKSRRKIYHFEIHLKWNKIPHLYPFPKKRNIFFASKWLMSFNWSCFPLAAL